MKYIFIVGGNKRKQTITKLNNSVQDTGNQNVKEIINIKFMFEMIHFFSNSKCFKHC